MFENYQEQIAYSANLPLVPVEGEFDHVVIIGMGGSALPGEILKACYQKKPVIVVRDYHIPDFVGLRSMVFVISYSGNTEETISAYKEAKKRKAQILIITCGGHLGEMPEKKIFLQGGMQPRDGVPSMLVLLLRLLGQDIDEKRLSKVIDRIDMGLVKKVVGELKKGKLPIVYGSSEKYTGVVGAWKNLFNENCKIPCHCGVFSEVNHNEIEMDGKNCLFLFVKDKEEQQLEKHALFSHRLFHYIDIPLEGGTLLERVMYALLMGSCITKGYAFSRKVDSYHTFRIIDLKEYLRGKK